MTTICTAQVRENLINVKNRAKMFSYGSRAGVTGRRGHGGYQPPRRSNRRRAEDVNEKTPPPVKQCGCIIQLSVEEYCEPTENDEPRQHRSFVQGRKGMENCKKTMRQKFGVHLLVPGKRQKGNISILSESHEQAIPAVHWLLSQITIGSMPCSASDSNTYRVEGTLHYNSSNQGEKNKSQTLNGFFNIPPSNSLFMSSSNSQSVMVYRLSPSSDDHGVAKNFEQNSEWNDNYSEILRTLEICMDNMQFYNGPTEDLSFYISYPYAYGMGSSSYLNQLFEEVDRAMVAQSSNNIKDDKQPNQKGN